ncbi:MAG: hypothetical protein U0X39_05855 [Bacteroidales bacterium]
MNINGSSCIYTSTENSTTAAWYRQINDSNLKIERTVFDKRDGFAVRCVKD